MADPRNLRAYVSAYSPDRVHVVRLSRGSDAVISADFKGAIAGRQVESIVWRCANPWTVRMSDAGIEGAVATVRVKGQWGNGASLRCEATLDDGSVVVQQFRLHVRSGPWFYGEPLNYSMGPYDLASP